MKLHLPKQLFTALLAAITLAAPSARGANELSLQKGADAFYADDYAFSFILNDDAFAGSNTVVVVGGYWGKNATGNEQNSNGIVATRDEQGNITLTIGQGKASSVGESADLSASSTFAFYRSNKQTFTTHLQTGVVYTVKAVGANGAMDPALYDIAAGSAETVDGTYPGNMNGGDDLYSAFNDDSAVLVSANGTGGDLAKTGTLVWAGTPADGAAAWTAGSATWNNISGAANGVAAEAANDVIFDASSATAKTVNLGGSLAVKSISIYDNYTFDATAATTLSITEGLSIASGKTLTLQGNNITLSSTGTTTLSGTITNNGTLELSGSNSSGIIKTNAAVTKNDDNTVTHTGATINNSGHIDMSGLYINSGSGGKGDVNWHDKTAQYTSLINSIVGGTVLLNSGDFTLQLGGGSGTKPAAVDFRAVYTVEQSTDTADDGSLTLANHSNSTLWRVSEGGGLNVNKTLRIANKQDLLIAGGSVTAGDIKLAHDLNDNPGATLSISSGTLKTGTITVEQHNTGTKQTAITMNGGSLEFTMADAISVEDTSTAPVVSITGGTLKATVCNWTLDATGWNKTPDVSNVTIDGDNTHNITLKGVNLGGTITNNATTENTGLALENVTVSGSGITFSGAGATTLSGTTNLSGTITNNGTLNLNGVLNITDLAGLKRSNSYSDGDNGIFTGSFSVVATGAEGVLKLDEASFGLKLNGSALSTSTNATTYYTYDSEKGSITINEADNKTYWINTKVSYDADKMQNVGSFIVAAGAEFYLTDASVLARTDIHTDTSKVYFRGSETNLLRFTGASGGAGLNLTASGASVTMGDITDYAGNIIVLNGTTLDIAGKQYSGHIVLEGGATLGNTGSELATGAHVLPTLELAGNATVSPTQQLVMNSTSGSAGELDLNGYTLTKTGNGKLYLNNLAITSGTLQIDKGTVQTADGVTLVSGAALDVIINDGILHTQASLSLNTLTLGANADEVCVDTDKTLTVTGATSAAGKFSKTGAGTLTLQGATTFGGEVCVTSGRLKVTGALTAGAINKTGGGTLELAAGSGQKKINGTTSSITGGILAITQQDAIDYEATTSTLMSISGATLQLDARQTVNSTNVFTLSSGHITGTGGTYDDTDATFTAGLDIHNASTLTINSSGTSIIGTGIGLRKASGKVNFNVTAGTLTTSGAIAGNGGIIKTSAGKLVLSGDNTYAAGTTIDAGTVTTQNASALGTGDVNMTGGELVVSNVTNTDDPDLTVGGAIVMNAAATAKLATTGTTLSLGTTGSVKKSNADGQYVTIASDGTHAASMTAKAANAQLVQLQEDASFTIEDMTLTNTTITAATTTTQVKLQNVEATSNVVLAKGKFTMGETAQVSTGGAGTTGNDFTTSLLSGITLANTDEGAGSTITVDLGDLSCVSEMGPGKYDLSITLSGFTMKDYTQGIVFEGWLGELISASSGVQVSFSKAEAAEPPAAAAEGGAATGVTYSTGSVGTVINIYGLNVPEPATSTLSLLALAALAARRRRKA